MIRNRPIYHCQLCGAVLAQDGFHVPPFCCGHEMVNAAEETLQDSFVHELDVEPNFAQSQLAPRRTATEQEHLSAST